MPELDAFGTPRLAPSDQLQGPLVHRLTAPAPKSPTEKTKLKDIHRTDEQSVGPKISEKTL